MSARNRRIAAPLAVAIFGIGLGASVLHTASGAEPAAGVAEGGVSAAPAANAPAPRIKSPHLPASPSKPVAAIAIGYEFATKPQLGVPFDVRISVQGSDGITGLALTVRPGNGAQAGTPQLTQSSADGAERTWTVAATAFNEGSVYLSVLAQGTAGDQHPARSLLIPIRTGTAVPSEPTVAPQPRTDSTGQRVIVLPAEDAR